MKSIKQYIFEKLTMIDLANITHPGKAYMDLSDLFNEYNKGGKTLEDFKKNDYSLLFLVSNETGEVLKEYQVKPTTRKYNTLVQYWYSVKDIKDISEEELDGFRKAWRYGGGANTYNFWEEKCNKSYQNKLSVSSLGGGIIKEPEALELLGINEPAVGFWVINKENKDAFIKWIKELSEKSSTSDIEKKIKDAKHAKHLAEDKKRRTERKNKKEHSKNLMDIDLSNLYKYIQKTGSTDCDTFDDFIDELKFVWDDDTSIYDTDYDDIFAPLLDKDKTIYCDTIAFRKITNPSDLDNEFKTLFGRTKQKAQSKFPNDFQHTNDWTGLNIYANYGIDKNGIFMCLMTRDKSADGLVLMGDTK